MKLQDLTTEQKDLIKEGLNLTWRKIYKEMKKEKNPAYYRHLLSEIEKLEKIINKTS